MLLTSGVLFGRKCIIVPQGRRILYRFETSTVTINIRTKCVFVDVHQLIKTVDDIMTSQGIDRIPDSLGYLVLTEDGAVVSSGGDLENDEMTAGKITKLVYTAAKIPVTSDKRDTFKRISVVWDDFMYVITVSNHKIYTSKRKYIPQEPVAT